MKLHTRLIVTPLPALSCTVAAVAQDAVSGVTQEEADDSAVSKPLSDDTPIARQRKLEGKVELEAPVAPDGTVDNVKFFAGNSTSIGAAGSAMMRCVQPFLAYGKQFALLR